MAIPRLRLIALAAALAPLGSLRAATLRVDQRESSIQIRVRATLTSFVARLPHYDAAIVVESGTGKIESVRFKANFDEVKTGIAARDADMNEWQQSKRFPQLRFRLTALEPAERGSYIAHGLLLFHGVQEPVSFPVAVTTDQKLLAVDGELAVDTRAFGLPVIRKFLILTVNPVVHLRFHLQGDLVGA